MAEPIITPIEPQKNNDVYEKVLEKQNKIQMDLSSIRSDLDKLKGQLTDKISKAVLSEIENKINNHTKALDATSKKLFDLQSNVNVFIQQPISHTLIDSIKKQLTDDILSTVKSLMTEQKEETQLLLEEAIKETRAQINNSKKFMYH